MSNDKVVTGPKQPGTPPKAGSAQGTPGSQAAGTPLRREVSGRRVKAILVANTGRGPGGLHEKDFTSENLSGVLLRVEIGFEESGLKSSDGSVAATVKSLAENGLLSDREIAALGDLLEPDMEPVLRKRCATVRSNWRVRTGRSPNSRKRFDDAEAYRLKAVAAITDAGLMWDFEPPEGGA